MPERVLAVIDGNSLLHRAFHALPVSMTAPDGRPTNAVYGFISMLLKLCDRTCPDDLIVAFDKGKPAFRIEALERYKVHRPPMPDDLRPQFGMLKQVLDAMNVPWVELEGWEGDDILGTLATKGVAEGWCVQLITGDKDALQLVNDKVSVVTTRQGITDIKVYDAEGVVERLGVRPDQVADYLGLKGDTSDNIPGVPGIGEKTAAKLIQQFGSLEGVLEHAEEVPGKVGENLRSNSEEARVSKLVATIRCDVPIEIDLNAATWGSVDPDAVVRVLGELRMVSLVERVLALGRKTAKAADGHAGSGRPSAWPAGGSEPGPGASIDEIAAALGAVEDRTAPAAGPGPVAVPVAQPAGAFEPWPIRKGEQAIGRLHEAIDASEQVAVACDVGEQNLFPCNDLAFALASREVVIVPADLAPGMLIDVLARARLVAADLKSIVQRFAPTDAGTAGLERFLDEWVPERTFDVGVAAYVLESHRSSYDTVGLYGDAFGRAVPLPGEPEPAIAIRAQIALELAGHQAERLALEGSRECFDSCESPLIPVLARMEAVGVGVDTSVLGGIAEELGTGIERLRADIFELAGTEFTIDSPKQLGEVLFDKLGLPAGRRTKTGYSTDAGVLTSLAGAYPVCGKVIEYREMTKLKSTYVDTLPRLIGADGRLHTTFNQTVAATGRLSSSNPNLQNIPVRTPLGQRIRAAFVPARPGDVMVSADYSQIELRVLAHLSEDPGLIAAFTSGEDFHTETASRVFGVEPEQVTPEHRRRAKAVNFGIVYGISSHGLSESLRIPRADAQAMIDRYYAAYPGVRAFLDRTVSDAHALGYAVTMFGRRRWIPELKSTNYNLRSFGERTAMNHPMQGTAADIMKIAMVAVDDELRAGEYVSRMVLQVHDELVFEAPASEVERLAEMVRSTMESVVVLSVPVETAVAWGDDWAAAK